MIHQIIDIQRHLIVEVIKVRVNNKNKKSIHHQKVNLNNHILRVINHSTGDQLLTKRPLMPWGWNGKVKILANREYNNNWITKKSKLIM